MDGNRKLYFSLFGAFWRHRIWNEQTTDIKTRVFPPVVRSKTVQKSKHSTSSCRPWLKNVFLQLPWNNIPFTSLHHVANSLVRSDSQEGRPCRDFLLSPRKTLRPTNMVFTASIFCISIILNLQVASLCTAAPSPQVHAGYKSRTSSPLLRLLKDSATVTHVYIITMTYDICSVQGFTVSPEVSLLTAERELLCAWMAKFCVQPQRTLNESQITLKNIVGFSFLILF